MTSPKQSSGSRFTSLTDIARWKYLARSVWHQACASRRSCPNCGGNRFAVLKAKYLVTALARCCDCRILYRLPTDGPHFNHTFYQDTYRSGLTTEYPDAQELEGLRREHFRGTPKDLTGRIKMLDALGAAPGQRILDYGASWGYGVWQLVQAGFDAVGFEISRPRARYAREKLGVHVVDDLAQAAGPFDVVFACHVLEHLSRPTDFLNWLPEVLRPGGLLVAFTPNGSVHSLKVNPARYHRGWGLVHPYYLDDEFYCAAFPQQPKVLASPPYDLEEISAWERTTERRLTLSGWELLCVIAF
jgi:2-polyprenyl-3-methyl-5-hydroxy-6-metoxy-1,4-benzoquinol methylase